jgi:hypothetical protein
MDFFFAAVLSDIRTQASSFRAAKQRQRVTRNASVF